MLSCGDRSTGGLNSVSGREAIERRRINPAIIVAFAVNRLPGLSNGFVVIFPNFMT